MNPLLSGNVRVALAAFILIFAGSSFAGEGWLVSFEKAKAQAAKEGALLARLYIRMSW